jgi:GxxExxY protein
MVKDVGQENGKAWISDSLNALSYAVIGAALEVHRCLGPGFLESVYQKALCVELALASIPFETEIPIDIEYKGRKVGEGRLDLLVERSLIVELKAVDTLLPIHKAQLLSYMKASGARLGLLMNFNVAVLKEQIVRLVL